MKVLKLVFLACLCFASANAQDKSTTPPGTTEKKVLADTASKTSTIDPAKEKDIRTVLEITGTKARMQQAMSEMETSVKPLMEKSLPPGEYRAQLIDAFFAKFHAEVDLQKLLDQAVASYDRHFSHEEIKQLVQFYGTPVGQKIAAVLPDITTEMMNAGREMGQELGRKCMLEVLAEHPEYAKAMEEAGKAARQ